MKTIDKNINQNAKEGIEQTMPKTKKPIIISIVVIIIIAIIISSVVGLKSCSKRNEKIKPCCQFHCTDETDTEHKHCGIEYHNADNETDLKIWFCCEQCPVYLSFIQMTSGNNKIINFGNGNNNQINDEDICVFGNVEKVIQDNYKPFIATTGNESPVSATLQKAKDNVNQNANTAQDSIVCSKPAQTEPTKQAPTTEPTKPTQTTKPAPTEPTKPAPTEPTKPAPTEPTKPAPTEPTKPAPTEPAKQKISVTFVAADRNGTLCQNISATFSGIPENATVTTNEGSVKKISNTVYRIKANLEAGTAGRIIITVKADNLQNGEQEYVIDYQA